MVEVPEGKGIVRMQTLHAKDRDVVSRAINQSNFCATTLLWTLVLFGVRELFPQDNPGKNKNDKAEDRESRLQIPM